MQTRRTFRRRLKIVGLMVGLGILAFFLLTTGVSRLKKVDRYDLAFVSIDRGKDLPPQG